MDDEGLLNPKYPIFSVLCCNIVPRILGAHGIVRRVVLVLRQHQFSNEV